MQFLPKPLFQQILVLTITLAASSTSYAIRGGQLVSNFNSESPYQGRIGLITELIVSIQKEPRSQIGSNQFQHKCSGLLITSNLIITAAHCFDDGDFNIKVTSESIEFLPKQIGLHKHYQRQELFDDYWKFLYDIQLHNDYALIEIEAIPSISALINYLTIHIKNKDSVESNHALYVMGFGQTANIFGMGEGEGQLRITGPLSAHPKTKNRVEVKDNVRGACQGDSGGPLLKFHQDKIELIGTVSQGDCNTFSRYQLISKSNLKKSLYRWFKNAP